MSARRSLIQNVSSMIDQPFVLPTIQRSTSTASPNIYLKGLLGTLPPSDKDIPIPAYAFPKLKKMVEDLQVQLTEDNTKSILWLTSDQYMFLKNLLIQIEQKISHKKVPKTSSYGVSLDVLLVLVGKLQKYTGRKQHRKLKQILMVIDKFVAIEKCLIGKIESQQTLRDKLVYDLDVLFEAFLIDVISSEEEWTPTSIQSKLKRRLTAVSEQDLHPMIEQCSEEPTEIIIETRTSTSLYVKIRNELLLLCNEFAVQLPTPLTITMEYIRSMGKLVCEHSTSIENIISVFVMMGHSKNNAILISGLVKFYCDMQKDAKMSSITRFLLLLVQFKKAQDKEAKKKQNTLVPEVIENANKAKKVMNDSQHETIMRILEMNLAMGIPLTEEEKAYLKEHSSTSTIHSVSSREKVQSNPSREKPMKEEKPTKEKPLIPIPSGPKNPATLFGKYTSLPGKATAIADISIIQYVKDMINDLDIDTPTAGLLLTGFFALRRSFQIEGWNTFVRSFQYHLRKKLGEKQKGREPTPPIKLLSYGRTNFEKEKQVYLALNRATLSTNVMMMVGSIWYYTYNKVVNALHLGTSKELMEETVEQTEESETEEDIFF